MSGDDEIWDCHLHAFPASVANEGGVSGHALRDYLSTVAKPLEINRLVLVQPSRLATDHSVLFDALNAMEGRARGVAVLPQDGKEFDPAEWHDRGVRGLRYAPRLKQGGELEQLIELAPVLREFDWHIQVYADIEALPGIAKRLVRTGVPIVFDHFSRVDPGLSENHPSLRVVFDLLESGVAWIKFSAPYHFSEMDDGYRNMRGVARSFFDKNPEMILWGTDWPHPNVSAAVDERSLLRALDVWGFNRIEKNKILTENPSRLYR
ncbi:amidohydrolase family protein [Burkholderia sp. 22PA0099]|uniref:amidohydrolase family protein n=1 Tax=Burkholderia sp. 22PA0099 TaxID=3237372 RepID=UPI0039C06F1E